MKLLPGNFNWGNYSLIQDYEMNCYVWPWLPGLFVYMSQQEIGQSSIVNNHGLVKLKSSFLNTFSVRKYGRQDSTEFSDEVLCDRKITNKW